MSWRRTLFAVGLVVLGVGSVDAQDRLKNVQILTGMSRSEVWEVMNQMASGLGVTCQYCHEAGDVASDGKPQKRRGREMMRMVIDLNARHFSGQPVVTCFTCHGGHVQPSLMPPLPQTVPVETKRVEATALPEAASVIRQYVRAVGREVAPSTARRFTGTLKSPTGPPVQGTLITAGETTRLDAQAPDGSRLTRVFDATGGWLRDKSGVRDLTSQEFDAVRQSYRPFEPFHTSSIGDDVRVTDAEDIDGRRAWVLTTAHARYWFDAASGYLLRRVRYVDSPIGRIPERTDFDDYRDVREFTVPFVTRAMLVDPYLGGTRQAEAIELGVTVAPGEFEKPSEQYRNLQILGDIPAQQLHGDDAFHARLAGSAMRLLSRRRKREILTCPLQPLRGCEGPRFVTRPANLVRRNSHETTCDLGFDPIFPSGSRLTCVT